MLNRLSSRISPQLHLTIIGVILAIVSTTGHAGILKSGFTITYEVTHNDMYLGDALRTFKLQNNGTWEYRSATKGKGIIRMLVKDTINETSTIQQHANSYQPLSYRYHQHGGKKEKKHNIIFDWESGDIRNDYTNKSYPLKTGTHDLLSFQIQLMRDLQDNKQSVTYIIADKKRVDSYSLKVVTKTELTTPFKTLDTIKLVSNKIRNKTQFFIWCAPELNYLPVKILKIDDDGDSSEINLKAISFGQ